MSIRTSRSSKRLIAAAVAVAVTASTFAISTTAGATGTTAAPAEARLGGADRFATAALVSAAVSTSAAPVTEVILVNGRNFPDGLAASALATNSALTSQRPILLTESGSLPAETAAALQAIKGLTTVHIIGGTSAVSSTVLGEVADAVPGVALNRIDGADRYATAIAVATVASNSATATPSHVILATGENFPDALAAGALAAANGWPLVLNSGTTLRTEVSQFLTNVSNAATGANDLTVLVVGGTSVVPASVVTAINALDNVTAQRLAGANRFETAVAVAASVSATPAGVVLANGRDFPDALAASALAAKVGAPILLTEADSIPTAIAAWHLANSNTLTNVRAIGGTSVISAEVLSGAKAAATAQVPVLTLASLTATATTSASVALTTSSPNNVTVTALAAGVAKGALGNNWTVSISATAATTLGPVITVSTSASPFPTSTDAISTSNAVIIAVPAGGITAANLKTAFDASPAAEIFAMTVGVGSTVVTVSAANGGVLTGGTTEVKVALTFSQAVIAGTGNVVFAASAAFNASTLDTSAIASYTISGASVTKTIAATLTDLAVLAAWTTGTAEVRLAKGVVTTPGALLENPVTATTLTVS